MPPNKRRYAMIDRRNKPLTGVIRPVGGRYFLVIPKTIRHRNPFKAGPYQWAVRDQSVVYFPPSKNWRHPGGRYWQNRRHDIAR